MSKGDRVSTEVTPKRPRRCAFASPEPPPPVSLPFASADVAGLRLLPAELARFLGVSKQSVSRWIKAGKVKTGPDGRIDPVDAVRGVVASTDLDKLRARILRAAAEPIEAMRERVERLQASVDGEPARRLLLQQQTRAACDLATSDAVHQFNTAVALRFDAAKRAHDIGGSVALAAWLDSIAREHFPGLPLAGVTPARVLPNGPRRGHGGSRFAASDGGNSQVNGSPQG